MARTDAMTMRQACETFFRDELLPLAATLKQAHGPFFPLGPDASVPTYYVARSKTRMDKADFEAAGTDGPAMLTADLSRLWQASGTPELVRVARSLADIARVGRKVETEHEGDVSPFMYAMY
jgi:hypothetical protein